MAETEYTPGPLVAARENEYRTCIETTSGRVLGAAFGDWGDTPEQHAEIEANAALWAAAPDMFEALEAVVSAFAMFPSGKVIFGDIAEVRAALAKALAAYELASGDPSPKAKSQQK